MFCQQCGAEIPAGQNVCPGCYAPVKPQGLARRLFDWLLSGLGIQASSDFRTTGAVETRVVRKTETIKVRDETSGEERVYQSLQDVPPQVRARIDAALANKAGRVQQTFTFRDASGQTQTYHSLDEMPPDIRAVFERAQREQG